MSVFTQMIKQVMETPALDEQIADMLTSTARPMRACDVRAKLQVEPSATALQVTLGHMVSIGQITVEARRGVSWYAIVPKETAK